MTTHQSAELTAPLARGAGEKRRDVQTEKECQDWLISEYDLEVKRLEARLDEAIEMLDILTKILQKLMEEGKNG